MRLEGKTYEIEFYPLPNDQDQPCYAIDVPVARLVELVKGQGILLVMMHLPAKSSKT